MRTVRETKLPKDTIDKLRSMDLDTKSYDRLTAAIDDAYKACGIDLYVNDIMKVMSQKFNDKTQEEAFKSILCDLDKNELTALRDYLIGNNSCLTSIINKAKTKSIWKLSEENSIGSPLVKQALSKLYDITSNTGGRRIRGKGEYLLSILFGNNCKFTNDFDLAIGNEIIEVKAYGGRLDGNYSKAATVSPNTCFKILKEVLDDKDPTLFNQLKGLYSSGNLQTGHDNLFVKAASDPKRKVLANTPAALNNGSTFNLDRKSSFILGLGKLNLKNQWPEFIEALRHLNINDKNIYEIIYEYLKGLYTERYSEYKQDSIKILIDETISKIAKSIIGETIDETLALIAELELELFVETATSNKINRGLQNLVLIGKTSTNDIYVLLIGFKALDAEGKNIGNSIGKNLGDNIRKGNVLTTKFDSSNQGSNIGLKISGTKK